MAAMVLKKVGFWTSRTEHLLKPVIQAAAQFKHNAALQDRMNNERLTPIGQLIFRAQHLSRFYHHLFGL